MVKTDLNSYLDKFYYKITKINELLSGKSDMGHNHDERYYTETETDDMVNGLSNQINEKADKSVVTTSTNGLMSKEDKSKLDGIATEANKTVVDSALSSSSTNPVQNKVVNSALNGKANSSHNHSISNITNLQLTLENKSPTGHTHDDRYYTKTEMNTELNGKANSSHTHSISNITNLQSALDEKAHLVHNHDNLYYTEAEIDEKLNGKADSTHTHNISDVTGLSTSLDGKMSNNYSESTIESNFFAHKIGNIVIVTWWGGTLPTTQNSWVDWKTLPYESCNTQPIWVNGDGVGCEVRVRVPPNSNKLQVFIDGGTGTIRPGMIVYPTK